MKLKATFGGGPEIPFHHYQEEAEKIADDGSVSIVKESRHDFQPIRVRTHVIKRAQDQSSEAITLLVSRHQTNR